MSAGAFVSIVKLSLDVTGKPLAQVNLVGYHFEAVGATGAEALLSARAKIEALLVSFDAQAEKLLGPDWKSVATDELARGPS